MTSKFTTFFDDIISYIPPNNEIFSQLSTLKDWAEIAQRVLIVGNGGSSAIASHVAEDWTKICKVPTTTLHDPALMSCFANDYGWDNWVAKAISYTNWKIGQNLGIFISSSGNSVNIINGAKKFKELGQIVITFSGFEKDNPLSTIGHLNFHVSSTNYNVIELTHELWLLSLCEIMESQLK